MGYCVTIELNNVEIPKSKKNQTLEILRELNKTWQSTSDWCRFSDSDDLLEVIEDIGFECSEDDTKYFIEYFSREKLGDHENMFKSLAPVLNDCEIKFFGEDNSDWKIVVENHVASVIYRDDF